MKKYQNVNAICLKEKEARRERSKGITKKILV